MRKTLQYSLFILFFFLPFFLKAQQSEEFLVKKQKIQTFLKINKIHVGLSYLFWQEDLTLESDSIKEDFLGSFQGLRIQMGFLHPSQNNPFWIYTLSSALSFGTLKGQNNGTLKDKFKNQPWAAFTLSPGILLRPHPKNQIGLKLPIELRQHFWKYESESNHKAETEFQLTYGISGVMLTYLTLRSAILIQITHNFPTQTSHWEIGWQKDFY